MLQARSSGGIVVTTPSALKSIVNKYIELLNVVAEVGQKDLLEGDVDEELASLAKQRKKNAAKARKVQRKKDIQMASATADAIAKVMNLWSERERGILLLDEVDMLLHPLRSELNFPVGEKFPLQPSPTRWDLPIHLLDMLLQASYIAMESSSSGGGAASGGAASGGAASGGAASDAHNLQDIVSALQKGLHEKSLQRTPHLVLLDHEFYTINLRDIVARRSLTWMKAHHVFEGLEAPSQEHMLEYVTKGNDSSEVVKQSIGNLAGQANNEKLNAGNSALQVLNLAYDLTCSFVPHTLSKVCRVNFGLLQPQDEQVLGGEQPASRKLLGIPFVGKDVPSPAAEFAQPDVLIGATILAYRYEGMRRSDLKTCIRLLKENLQQESGPKSLRPAFVMFELWVTEACKKNNKRRRVMDLELFQLSDVKQMSNLYNLIHMESSVIHYYLRDIVFPTTMQQQRVKISSSGQELGSDILFGRRLGFSGTPSNLLPVDIVPCHFEKGSEGKIIRSLTDSNITKEAKISKEVENNETWSVKGVLDQIAQSTDPPFHALIDTGAYVTGYSNEEVARYLTDTGLKHLQGCVFLDHLDRKMIYLRGAARCIPLSECGLARGKRFTFYDQVHTTGMDIKQQISACACLTIGKDMTFRDYAQGAYRMRGIGQGQTIHLYIVPEIKKLIEKTLPKMSGNMEDDVAAWLQLNNMKMEKLQFLQLCSQSMQTIWRKVALNNLLGSSGITGSTFCFVFLSFLFFYFSFSYSSLTLLLLFSYSSLTLLSVPGVDQNIPTGRKRFFGKSSGHKTMKHSMSALKDVVDFDIPKNVPTSEPYSQTLQKMVDGNKNLVKSDEQHRTVSIVMKQVDNVLKSNDTGQAGKKGLNSEMTREKEREQEQQKQKQQQQQTESMFERDTSQPYQWSATLLDAQPLEYEESMNHSNNGTKWEHEFPFYPLSIFSPRPKDFEVGNKKNKISFPKINPLEFPHGMLQSTNFATIGRDTTKPLKLKNVNIVLDWINTSTNVRRTIVVTLSEAETLRRIIQNRRMYKENEHIKLALIVIPQCLVLESTAKYDTNDIDHSIIASTKFWNNEMFYKENETELLLKALHRNSKDNRRQYFEASLAARRRARKSWVGTPGELFILKKNYCFELPNEMLFYYMMSNLTHVSVVWILFLSLSLSLSLFFSFSLSTKKFVPCLHFLMVLNLIMFFSLSSE